MNADLTTRDMTSKLLALSQCFAPQTVRGAPEVSSARMVDSSSASENSGSKWGSILYKCHLSAATRMAVYLRDNSPGTILTSSPLPR